MTDNVAGKIHSQAVVDPGEGSGEPIAPPPSFLDQTEPQRTEKMFFWKPSRVPLISGSGRAPTPPPPPFFGGGGPPPPPPHLKVWICHCQVKLQTKLENWMPAMLMGRLTTKLVDHLTAKLVNHLTAKLMNHLIPKLVDHLTTKLMVVNIGKLHLTK